MAASGHAARSGVGLRVRSRDGASVVLKPADKAEQAIYEHLNSAATERDVVLGVVPAYHGVGEEDGEAFLHLENLTAGLQGARVLDVKLGLRTFQERELLNATPRADLFEKALKHCPGGLTAAEREARSMTKARYMIIREATTTTGTLGYRIDGVAGLSAEATTVAAAGISAATCQADCESLLAHFVTDAGGAASARHVASSLLEQLLRLRETLESSAFVAQHEFIGSSLLFVANEHCSRLAWIDFAKASKLPREVTVSHRAAWVEGNHEDGLLFGVDSLIVAWQAVVQQLGDAIEA